MVTAPVITDLRRGNGRGDRKTAPVKHAHWLAGAFVLLVLVGCGHLPEKSAPVVIRSPDTRAELVKQKLYAQYEQWKNTRHRTGGLSKAGIDCSGFVYLTFQAQLGVTLPRSTESQAEVGKSIDKNHLRSGDLVFFKTGMLARHVGIYLEHGKFLHVSTSLGVMISTLDDDYWKPRFWKARRVDA